MPKLDYTNDLRDLAGQTNDASELTRNLTDIQTRGRALDWENVVDHSLSNAQVYNPGGGSPQPLKDAEHGFTTTSPIGASGTWTTAETETATDLTVGESWIYIVCGGRIAAGTAGDTHQMRLVEDLSGGVNVKRLLEIGEDSELYGGAFTTFSFEATATSHVFDLQFQIDANHPKDILHSHLTLFVVHR
jgi:hypothetical protein